MTIKEKIILDKDGNIHLFKEGVFWVAYERSAYIIWLLKKYKPTKKFIKAAGQDVVSVGFPESALTGFGSFGEDKGIKGERHIVLLLESLNFENLENLGEPAFFEWKNSLNVEENKEFGVKDILREQLKNFDLSNATPLECMNFLAKIKLEI